MTGAPRRALTARGPCYAAPVRGSRALIIRFASRPGEAGDGTATQVERPPAGSGGADALRATRQLPDGRREAVEIVPFYDAADLGPAPDGGPDELFEVAETQAWPGDLPPGFWLTTLRGLAARDAEAGCMAACRASVGTDLATGHVLLAVTARRIVAGQMELLALRVHDDAAPRLLDGIEDLLVQPRRETYRILG